MKWFYRIKVMSADGPNNAYSESTQNTKLLRTWAANLRQTYPNRNIVVQRFFENRWGDYRLIEDF